MGHLSSLANDERTAGRAMEEAGWAVPAVRATVGLVRKDGVAGGGRKVDGRHDGEVVVGHGWRGEVGRAAATFRLMPPSAFSICWR